MNYLEANDGSRQATAIAAAVLVHVVLLYALITGSALKVVEVMRQPFETRIIAEPRPVAPAPPVPEQPAAVQPKPRPRPPPVAVAPPRPPAPVREATAPASIPYVPAPEVGIPTGQPAAGAITTTPVPAARIGPESPGQSGETGDAEGPGASVQLEGCTLPEYPAASIAAEETGTVALSFLVGADGRVLESRVDRSSGHRRLDEAARRALGRCKFRPAIVDGKPRRAWAHINYVWRLE
jgi:protein TonB